MTRTIWLRAAWVCATVWLMASATLSAQCPRYAAGSTVAEPEDLFSSRGLLKLDLTYETRIDGYGNTLYCFTNSDGAQSPTLHVHPGDRLVINFKNGLPAATSSNSAHAMPGMIMTGSPSNTCGAVVMNNASVNIHYHGTNTPPVCHQDEVITTLVDSGETFRYDVQFPSDEPPGLYWYHPHVHGISEAAVQGGASGAIIVEGIENVNPEVAGLPERVMVIRDSLVPGNPTPGGNIPSWDISLNYIPVPSPDYTPVIVPMKPLEKQFWRVVNASADTILDLQLQYDGKPQRLQVVALDGVPTGSQDGTSRGRTLSQSDILLAPAARAEFIVTGPATTVQQATLLTLNVDTGPDGDNDPQRPIATVETSATAPEPALKVSEASGHSHPQRFAGLSRSGSRQSGSSISRRCSPIRPIRIVRLTSLSPWTDRLRCCSILITRQPLLRRRVRWKTGPLKTAPWKTTNSIFIRSISSSWHRTVFRCATASISIRSMCPIGRAMDLTPVLPCAWISGVPMSGISCITATFSATRIVG